MEYRRLGKSGLKVSQLSFGSWVTFSAQMDLKKSMETMAVAYDYGCNFFDNAEVYAGGKSELIMGEALKKLKWPRMKYIVSTKFFWGITEGPNERNTLNRKYLLTAIKGSLSRLDMDYVDLVYCHRPDPNTDMEEVVWAMHDMVDRGYALYWGTSEWSAKEILQAYDIAEKYSLRKPIVEQPQYNLFVREKVEAEYLPVYEKAGIGLTTWSPLASGALTGKYLEKIPKGSRASMKSLSWLVDEITDERKKPMIRQLMKIADGLDCTAAQLAIAWCSKNPHVSTVITGASSVEQVNENMRSIEVYKKLKPSVMAELNEIFKS
ncbi:MAG: aldo/keto reductase [Proteobacteria bacterium]|jgi:voltage-dependent potassium channel beta subunit|nr:aldo/keto reductase [Pseudomonadota bacterium]